MSRSTIALSMSYVFIVVSVCILFTASAFAGSFDTLHDSIIKQFMS